MSSDDDIEKAVANTDLDEAAESFEDIDEDRSHWDKAPYWGWLLLVFGGAILAIGAAVYTGRFDFAFEFFGTIDLSGPAQEFVTWMVRIVIFITAVSALVVAPGDYIATLLEILDGFSYPSDRDE